MNGILYTMERALLMLLSFSFLANFGGVYTLVRGQMCGHWTLVGAAGGWMGWLSEGGFECFG